MYLVILPSFSLVERKQSSLSGRAKKRAENIINLPYEAKIINHLVTTERLKEYGFLSDAVGDICPYQDFYGGRPIKRKAKEVEETVIEDEEEEDSDNAEDQGAPDYGFLLFFVICPFSFYFLDSDYCLIHFIVTSVVFLVIPFILSFLFPCACRYVAPCWIWD